MRSKRIPDWAQVLGTAAAALAFLLVYELAVYRVPLQQIFLPCSYWSDEVIYSKQLAAVVRRRDISALLNRMPPAAPLPHGGRLSFLSTRCRGFSCAGRMLFCGAICCLWLQGGPFSRGLHG